MILRATVTLATPSHDARSHFTVTGMERALSTIAVEPGSTFDAKELATVDVALPVASDAATVKVYALPSERPRTEHDIPVVAHRFPPGAEVTTYRTTVPPVTERSIHETRAESEPSLVASKVA